MNLPKIGDTITPEMGIELAIFFNMPEIAQRIGDNPGAYKDFVFDGASCCPDKIAAIILNIPGFTRWALEHDISYAYGEPGDKKARKSADQKLKGRCIADGASGEVAEIIYYAVRWFGDFGNSSFGWGFARIAAQ